jgi:hypothetical protein
MQDVFTGPAPGRNRLDAIVGEIDDKPDHATPVSIVMSPRQLVNGDFVSV